MNGLTRWNPFREMEELQNRIETLFNLDPSRYTVAKDGKKMVSSWTPPVDITEDEKEYVIKAELPEVQKGDVKVTVENGVLTIAGERKLEKEEKDRKYHRVERVYGSFVRSFRVPDDTDDAKVAADFRDGVLTVRLPKKPEVKPQKITVNAPEAKPPEAKA